MKRTLPILLLISATIASAQTTKEIQNPMLSNAMSFLGTKYVAHRLDQDDEEKLVIDTEAVDCLTLVEYVLAKSLNSSFAPTIQKIRYRDGIIDGYTSRLHYTSEWIENNIKNGYLTDVTAIHSPVTLQLNLSYMSTHPQAYKQLANSNENVSRIATHEKTLTGRNVYWLPKDQLPDAGLSWIQEGDIIAIVTNIKGLDIAHLGFAVRKDGNLHLLHASSTLGKVVISEQSISQMLQQHKSWSGIRIFRLGTGTLR